MTNEPLHRVTDLELLRRDIHRQGDVLREIAGPLRAAAQEVVAAIEGDLPRIYLVGCGDSLDAGMATRLTWERWPITSAVLIVRGTSRAWLPS